MGTQDALSGRHDDASEVSAQDLPHGDEPGASTTQYADGQGTVGLGDRLGAGAPDTNQGKAEPMPPTPGQSDPVGTGPHTDAPDVPELGDMSAGRALGQVASPTVLPTRPAAPPAALPLDNPGDSRGVNVPHEQAAEGTSEEQAGVHGGKDPTR